jgi:hypothetical protein
MDINKQQLLIEYLVSSPDTFALCTPIIKAYYFDPELQHTVRFLQQYYNEYNALPDTAQIEAETGRILVMRDVPNDKIEYCANEIEQFCKRGAIINAAHSLPKLVDEGDYGKIEEMFKEAVTVSLNRHMGINFFENPEERIKKLLKTFVYEPTGWTEVDDILDGGLLRKQMILFSANSGIGKSIVMANLGLNYVLRGYTILLISLELSEEMIDMRYINMVTGFGTKEWRAQIDETSQRIIAVGDNPGIGCLHIVRMRNGTTSNDIRAYLKEFELRYGKVPDGIICDYLSGMGTNEFVRADQIHEKDKQRSEQLREIGEDYNAMIISASQQNRTSVDVTDLNHSHIAGGISKIDTTDIYISIIMTDAMRAKGEMAFQFLKLRSSRGLGRVIYLNFNPSSLRITNQNEFILNNREQQIQHEEPDIPGGLLGLMEQCNNA